VINENLIQRRGRLTQYQHHKLQDITAQANPTLRLQLLKSKTSTDLTDLNLKEKKKNINSDKECSLKLSFFFKKKKTKNQQHIIHKENLELRKRGAAAGDCNGISYQVIIRDRSQWILKDRKRCFSQNSSDGAELREQKFDCLSRSS
jgi:hypothetical protein